MNHHSVLQKASKVYAVIVTLFFGNLIGEVTYAQSSAPQFSKEFMCSAVPMNCLIEPYVSKKWEACAREVASGRVINVKSIKITELAVDGTRYGPLFTLLVSGEYSNGSVFRYTASCHVSKVGELIEFNSINLR